MMRRTFTSLVLSLFISGSVTASVEMPAPEDATGWTKQERVKANEWMVVTAHPMATEAAETMIQSGGSAVDAAIAAQLMLTLVEPQSSGIGGGAFALWHDGDTNQITAWDGRETAPAGVDETYFLDEEGRTQSWWSAMQGGKSVGVPGVVRMMKSLHQQEGRLPWKALFQPAIKAAKEGFVVGDRLHHLLAQDTNRHLRHSEAADYFYPEGEPLEAGVLKQNPRLARTLQILSMAPEEFYRGEIAHKIVRAVQGHSVNPGTLAHRDMAAYEPVMRVPVCHEIKAYRVCGMPPPTSGGVAVLEALALLEDAEWSQAAEGTMTAEEAHRMLRAMRLAFADRNHYIADPDFVPEVAGAVTQLLSDAYLVRRGLLLGSADQGVEQAGRLFPELPEQFQEGEDHDQPSTSHLSIVDPFGNALSMTTSIEMAFGSTVWVEGFLLNNQLTDFSFNPEEDGQKVANRPEAGKRPRSSMAPMLVYKNDQLHMVLGSPGGSRIIGYVLQALVETLYRNADAQAAVSQGHLVNLNGAVSELESGGHANLKGLEASLSVKGHQIKTRELNSGLHVIQRSESGGWISGVDPRREGLAAGR